MEPIKISRKSIEDFNGGKTIIPAPIDNKNLCEDAFEDDVFVDFYGASDHRKNGLRHLFGGVHIDTEETYIDGYVEVLWNYGNHVIGIELKATPQTEDFAEMRKNLYSYYRKVFKEWENPANEGLVVKFSEIANKLYVSFYFEIH